MIGGFSKKIKVRAGGAEIVGEVLFGSSAVLLDMTPDHRTSERLRKVIEESGDTPLDLHLRRVGPGHLAAKLSVRTEDDRDPAFCRRRLAASRTLSHLTIEVERA